MRGSSGKEVCTPSSDDHRRAVMNCGWWVGLLGHYGGLSGGGGQVKITHTRRGSGQTRPRFQTPSPPEQTCLRGSSVLASRHQPSPQFCKQKYKMNQIVILNLVISFFLN